MQVPNAQVPDVKEPMSEVQAVASGAVVSLIAGAGLGTMVVTLLAGSADMAYIVIVHAMFAMMLMGAWLGPALLQPGSTDLEQELP
jgi:hypothetical protein